MVDSKEINTDILVTVSQHHITEFGHLIFFWKWTLGSKSLALVSGRVFGCAMELPELRLLFFFLSLLLLPHQTFHLPLVKKEALTQI